MRAEPGRDSPDSANRSQGGELGLAVEPVAGLRLERRRSVTEHPAAVALDRGAQAVLARRARRPDGREDAAAAGVQLFVAGAAGAERELVDAVAAEGRVRVAVDEARDRAEPTAVDLDDVTRDGREVAHAPHRLDRLAAEEHVRVLDQLDL